MNYTYNEYYQYDSCVSRGLCSINPRTSSLQEVLVLYLKQAAYYALKLYDEGYYDENARNIILNTISVMVSNFEFSEADFKMLTIGFNKVLPTLIEEYKKMCAQKEIIPEFPETTLKFGQKVDVIKSIRFGEKEFLKTLGELSSEIRDLYKISFVLAKSICINILDLESFDFEHPKIKEGYLSILQLLNSLDKKEQDTNQLKDFMAKIAVVDNSLMKALQQAKEERYGKARAREVSYSTTPGKAILVVGSNIRELEDILEALKGENIDVYTHDEMILANTYPKFSEYPNLKGQFGQGIENCLLDFATFPGPIILTRHSLYNVEHLYRGLLYTTDFASSKGVIPIKNKDFSRVIKSAEDAKGFKKGKQCESVSVGYDYEELIKQVKDREGNFSRLFIIALGAYTLEQKTYFEKLLTQVPEDVLVISLSYCASRSNIICINACFDSSAVVRITEGLGEELSLPLTVFFPTCGRHTISQMIYLAHNSKANIYAGKCTPIMLNPSMMTTFHTIFGVNTLTSVKKDLEMILS